MAEITVKNPAGQQAGTVQLDDAVFGIQPNVPVMHQVVTAQLAHRRSGTQSTKTRAEVRGGGAKPYRQKGTGNARQGSIRAPHFSGGGVALGPKPRKYSQKTPKKMIRLALRSALSDRASEGKVVVVDDWGFDTPRTSAARTALGALGLDGRILVVVDRDDAATALSFRNLPEVQLIRPGELNAYDVLCNDWIVFTSANLPVDAADGSGQKLIKIEETGGAATVAPTADEDAADEDAGGEVPVAVHAEDPAEGSDAAADEPVAVQGLAALADERFGEGSHVALEDGSQPEGFAIKGNADSMLYHVPGSAFYDRTIAEVWFASAEAAEAAGFQLPPSQRDDEETSE